jgi:hypothetical protein
VSNNWISNDAIPDALASTGEEIEASLCLHNAPQSEKWFDLHCAEPIIHVLADLILRITNRLSWTLCCCLQAIFFGYSRFWNTKLCLLVQPPLLFSLIGDDETGNAFIDYADCRGFAGSHVLLDLRRRHGHTGGLTPPALRPQEGLAPLRAS